MLGPFQVMLRELLLLVIIAAAAMTSLKFGGIFGTTFLSTAVLLLMAVAITAVLDRGGRQAFAVGFVLCVAIYGGVALSARGQLLTSRALEAAFSAIATTHWINLDTGEEIPNYDPTQVPSGNVGATQEPDYQTFMLLGHLLCALLLGYIGGKFAILTYNRRIESG